MASRPWFSALEEGDLVGIHRGLRGSVDVNGLCPKSGRAPLQIAASHGHTAIVEALLLAGADDRLATAEEPRVPLRLAQFHGHTACVRLLLKREAARQSCPDAAPFSDPQTDHVDKSSVMIEAARRGDSKTVQRLLQEAPVYVHAMNERSGETAFTAALVNGRQRVCELLLEHGGGPFGVCLRPSHTPGLKKGGDSPVRFAAKERDVRMVQWLLKNGANIYTPAIDGLCSPLGWAAFYGAMDVVDELLKHGVQLDAKQCIWAPLPRSDDLDLWKLHNGELGDTTSWLLLANACWNLCPQNVIHLFDTREDLHNPAMMKIHGPMMLYLAAYRDNEEILMELLRRKAPVNGTIYGYCTPVYGAVQTDSVRMLQFLLDHGADTRSTVSKIRVSLLTRAAEYGAMGCINRLLEVDPVSLQWHGFQALDAAVRHNRTSVVALLMERLPKPIDYVARESLVSCAIDKGDQEIVELLLSHGIEPPAKVIQNGFVSACMRGHVEVAKVLLSYGADANVTYIGGMTMLLHQVLSQVQQDENMLQVARLLMQNGADVHATDVYGETPLAVVRRRLTHDKPAKVRRLLEAVLMELGMYGAVV